MSTTTPLTDGINALTAYANEVTGASDTTLSDAVERLAQGYGQGGGSSYTGLEYVVGNTGIEEVIWHGNGKIENACFNGLFSNVGSNIPISFPDHPTIVDTNAFYNARLLIDWSSLGAELIGAGSNTFRVNYQDDCSAQVVRLPKFDGLAHDGVTPQSCFGYTSSKSPSTYYFDTMQNIPRELFTNLSNPNFSATFGSIGHAVQSTGLLPFRNSTSAVVATITIYTTGDYLDTVVTSIGSTGSGTFTFVFKASENTTYNGVSYNAGDTITT